MADLRGGGVWPVSIHAQGQLQAWPARLAAWLPTGNWQVAGGYVIDADGLVSKDAPELRQAKFAVAPQFATPSCRLGGQLSGTASLRKNAGLLRAETAAELANLTVVDSTGKQFREPLVRLSAQGDYDPKSQVFQLAQCQLASSVVAAGAAGRIESARRQEYRTTGWAVQLRLATPLRSVASVRRPGRSGRRPRLVPGVVSRPI